MAFVAGPIALLVLAAAGRPASAHTGFESSIPADGAVVGEPVNLVTNVFTGSEAVSMSSGEIVDHSMPKGAA